MFPRRLLAACLCFVALALAPSAPAGTITLSLSPSSQVVEPGSSGFVLDFTMTTSSAIDLGAFNITVTVPTTSGITFTGGDSAVANYVFAGNSLGLEFSNPSGPNTADINDLAASANQHLDAGTYGLGEIFFSASANAPLGNVAVTLDSATSFTEGVSPFTPYDYAPAGGSMLGTIVVATVPEPSSLGMGIIAAVVGPLIVRWRGGRTRARK